MGNSMVINGAKNNEGYGTDLPVIDVDAFISLECDGRIGKIQHQRSFTGVTRLRPNVKMNGGILS